MPVNSPLQRQMAALADQHFDADGKCAFCGWGNSHSRQFGSTRAKHLAGSTQGIKACACVPEGVASELRALQTQHLQQQLFAQPPNSAPDAAAAAAGAADLADSKRAPRAPVRLADELAASAAGAASSSAEDAGCVTPEAVQRLYETHFTFVTLTADDGVVIYSQETAGLPPGVTQAVVGEAELHTSATAHEGAQRLRTARLQLPALVRQLLLAATLAALAGAAAALLVGLLLGTSPAGCCALASDSVNPLHGLWLVSWWLRPGVVQTL